MHLPLDDSHPWGGVLGGRNLFRAKPTGPVLSVQLDIGPLQEVHFARTQFFRAAKVIGADQVVSLKRTKIVIAKKLSYYKLLGFQFDLVPRLLLKTSFGNCTPSQPSRVVDSQLVDHVPKKRHMSNRIAFRLNAGQQKVTTCAVNAPNATL
ncbi:hypothetical protein GPALN_016230 [Globodera pallida]|nr:hypothetical protein GPALN_016230 [Globodera pallida]